MPKNRTREIQHLRMSEERLREIEQLVMSWPYETKSFMRARLNQYSPPSELTSRLWRGLLSLFTSRPKDGFQILKDPEILTNWQMRYQISGHADPQESWNKILKKEVSARDHLYMLSLLERELQDVHVPVELENLFNKIYRAHIRKEYQFDSDMPKSPLVLVVGPSGSGKTSTITQTIERVIFQNRVEPEIDLNRKKEEVLANEPFWRTLQEIDPELEREIAQRKKLRFYKFLYRFPLINHLFRKRISAFLFDLEEQGVEIDYSMVTPNDYQTALAGEPGNYLKKALGDPDRVSIRHLEEAHSAFGKTDGRESGAERQQRTLIDTSNIILDEIISGRRDCLLIATTDQPERFDAAIYRRFVEKGMIIDLSDYWQNPQNIREIVRLELLRSDIRLMDEQRRPCPDGARCIFPDQLDRAVEQLYAIFKERTLKIIPSYVRKLIHSLIAIKGGFSADYLEDPFLVRQAFELVAKNSYGDLFGRFVGRMDRQLEWEKYVGSVKDTFSEMANNCLFYGMDEEKGVVLNGPPGGGKTFLVRSWLSENRNVYDISATPSALQNPVNPIDGAVENLEKIYDIAKMIAPSVVFFDEGDALAPKRSPSGGSPSDKLTNKFLNLIDGEVPIHRVFTVLTTNRIDILDPALIRSKRLKVMDISGHLRQEDIIKIVDQSLKKVPVQPDLAVRTIVEAAKPICNTPADYAAFIEKAVSLRLTEFKVLEQLRKLKDAPRKETGSFIKLNFKTLMGIFDAVEAPQSVRAEIKGEPEEFLAHYDKIIAVLQDVQTLEKYPLKESHLIRARQEISASPTKKGKIQLDEYLEAELSQEPQIGFIIGVGANDETGMLLPIATSLMYTLSPEKVLVTGAVSSSSGAAAELDMAVQMTQQSAQEALTLVKNYFQSLNDKVSVARLLGEFLDKYTIHHQLLSASYNVGGPSAGYALAINTLSALLHIPVYNDFGITGAPWTKGVKKGEVGGSVIIGGHKKKAEKVLLHLNRMFMPMKNYLDLEDEFLAAYCMQGKDIQGVTSFGDLVPEVVWLGPEYEEILKQLIQIQIEHKKRILKGNSTPSSLKEEIARKKAQLRRLAEDEIVERLDAIRSYLRNPVRDPHLSLEEIFRRGTKSGELIEKACACHFTNQKVKL